MSTFHVYEGDRYVGLVCADHADQASSKARSKFAGDLQVVAVLYRDNVDPDMAQYIVSNYES